MNQDSRNLICVSPLMGIQITKKYTVNVMALYRAMSMEIFAPTYTCRLV